MPSDHIITLNMSETDEKSLTFQKQDYSMTSVAPDTRDILSDFLDVEITHSTGDSAPNSNQPENNGIGGNNDSFHHNLPSDLQFLRMDSFPPVSSIQPISTSQYTQQMNTPEHNVTSKFPSTYAEIRDTQSIPYTVISPMEVSSSQYQQTSNFPPASPSSHLSSPSPAQSIVPSPIPSPMQFMISNDPRSPTYESLQNSQQHHANSPQMIGSNPQSPNFDSLQNSQQLHSGSSHMMNNDQHSSSFESMQSSQQFHTNSQQMMTNEAPSPGFESLQNSKLHTNSTQLMSNNARSPEFQSLQNSQLRVNSPQMINEVSSSVENADKSVHFEEVSSQLSSSSLNMPITHSSPSPALINEPPCSSANTGLLHSFIQSASGPDKISFQPTNTVFTDSHRQFGQHQTAQVSPGSAQFQSLPPGLLTSVQNAALPPGAILVLTAGQFQNTTQSINPQLNSGVFQTPVSQSTVNQLNNSQQFQTSSLNSPNQFNQQTFQTSLSGINQFTLPQQVQQVQSQSQMMTTPVASVASMVTSPVQLNQFTTFNPAQFQNQKINTQGGAVVGAPVTKLDTLPPLVIQPNSLQLNNNASSQSKVGDNDLRIIGDQLDNNAYAQLKELLQQLYPGKLNTKQENNNAVSQSLDKPSPEQNVQNVGLLTVRPNAAVSNDMPVPIQVDIPNHVTVIPTPVFPHAASNNDKITFAKLLETYLKEQVIKQVQEEELKRKNSTGMEPNQNVGFDINQHTPNLETPGSPVVETSAVQVGQKRQLSPTRLTFQRDSLTLGNDSKCLSIDVTNSEMNSHPLGNVLGNPLHASNSEPTLQLSHMQNYRNVEQFSEDMTQFLESNEGMDIKQRPKLLISGPSNDDSDKTSSSMLRKILTTDVDNCNSSPSPSPVSSPDIQLESPSSLSSPNSVLFDGNTTLTLLQKSEELNLNSDNLDDQPTSELWNTCTTVFSDDDSMVPPKSHKSKRNHDTHSTTFDKTISVDSWFDAGGATNPSAYSFAQYGNVEQFGETQPQKVELPTSAAVTTQTPIVAGGESLKSVVPPVVKSSNRKAANKDASLNAVYPNKVGDIELRILTQPEEQHRARYLTEGSRGAVKDISQQSYPIIQLLGVNEPTTVQIFIANESGKIKPHGFYQACKVCGKNSTQCMERTIDRTVVIETEIMPSPDMTLTVDCVGILKLRNADVENRIGTAKAKASKKNNTKARMVFRVTVKKPDGNFQVLQCASNSILCTQPKGQPEIGRISLNSGSVDGGESLFIIGKNFVKGTKVLFRDVALKDGSVIWEKEADIDNEFFQKQHLICTVPEYHMKDILKPAQVQVVVRCDGKMSDPQKYMYTPVPTSIKKEVPMETDEDSPLSAELKKYVEKAQHNLSASLFQIPQGSLPNGFNPSGLTTQPVNSFAVAGHPGLQAIAGHDKMIMTASNPNATVNQQSKAGINPQLIMVNSTGGLNQSNLVSLGTSSQNQSQPMIVLLPNNSTVNSNTVLASNPTSTYNTQVSVEEYLKNLLRNVSTNQD